MLEAKLEGKEIVAPEPAKEAPVVDLMEALKQSVAQARKDKPAAKPKAKKSAAKAPPRSAPPPAAGAIVGSRTPTVTAVERLGLRRRRPAGTRRLELSLEEALVDLALVDRDGLLDADPDDLVSIETQLLRQLLRR